MANVGGWASVAYRCTCSVGRRYLAIPLPRLSGRSRVCPQLYHTSTRALNWRASSAQRFRGTGGGDRGCLTACSHLDLVSPRTVTWTWSHRTVTWGLVVRPVAPFEVRQWRAVKQAIRVAARAGIALCRHGRLVSRDGGLGGSQVISAGAVHDSVLDARATTKVNIRASPWRALCEKRTRTRSIAPSSGGVAPPRVWRHSGHSFAHMLHPLFPPHSTLVASVSLTPVRAPMCSLHLLTTRDVGALAPAGGLCATPSWNPFRTCPVGVAALQSGQRRRLSPHPSALAHSSCRHEWAPDSFAAHVPPDPRATATGFGVRESPRRPATNGGTCRHDAPTHLCRAGGQGPE